MSKSKDLNAHAIFTCEPPASFAVACNRSGGTNAFVIHPGDTFAFEYRPDDGPALADMFADLADILRQTPAAAEAAIAEATEKGVVKPAAPAEPGKNLN